MGGGCLLHCGRDVWLHSIRIRDMSPSEATVGDSTNIHSSVVLMADGGRTITIGENTKILRGGEILGPASIGADCFINRDAYIRADTTIGNNVAIGPFCRFITDSHEIGPASRRAGKNKTAPIIIGDGTWVGASVTVLGGVTIGRGCVIAAGSMVTRDIPGNSLAAGVPAKVIRYLDDPAPAESVWRRVSSRLFAAN